MGGQCREYGLGYILSVFKNCSEEVCVGCQYVCDFGEGEYMQPSTHFWQKFTPSHDRVAADHEEQTSLNDFSVFLGMKRCQNLGLWQFSQRTEHFISDFHPEFLSGYVDGWQLLWTKWLNPCRTRWQMTILRWHMTQEEDMGETGSRKRSLPISCGFR